MKGHYRDPGGIALGSPNAKPGVFIKFQGVLPPVDPTAGVAPIGCMGARVEYIAEDPDHPHRGDIIDMNGLPLFANEGELEIDACDNNHDKDMSVGDQLDMGVLSGPYTGYGIDGVVVDGKFECKSPDIACEQDL